MRFRIPKLIVIIISFAFSCVGDARTRADLVPEDTLLIDLLTGRVVIEMFSTVAPGHVARIRALARAGLYDGVAFHRVIDGFMAQTGDVKYGNVKSNYTPSLVGTGNSDLANLSAEFNELKHLRGRHRWLEHPILTLLTVSSLFALQMQLFWMVSTPFGDRWWRAWSMWIKFNEE